jgi:DNA-binding transcriptional MerR regulator
LEDGNVRYLSIGEFAERTRLSPKALRLYDESGLLVPARVDDRSGYRYYGEEQIDRARLVASLRRLDVPLATVATIVDLSPVDAAAAIARWWETVEARTAERRELAAYLQASLRGEVHNVYDIQTRQMPARTVATINRRVDLAGIDAFFNESFGRLRGLGAGLEGIAGCPYLVFYGEVSEDSDGPVELARPVSDEAAAVIADEAGIDRIDEPAHDEVFIRLPARDMSWPAMQPAYEALGAWVATSGRSPSAHIRQVLIADQRTADPDTLVCDLSVPLG